MRASVSVSFDGGDTFNEALPSPPAESGLPALYGAQMTYVSFCTADDVSNGACGEFRNRGVCIAGECVCGFMRDGRGCVEALQLPNVVAVSDLTLLETASMRVPMELQSELSEGLVALWTLKNGPPGASIDPFTGVVTWPSVRSVSSSRTVKFEIDLKGSNELQVSSSFRVTPLALFEPSLVALDSTDVSVSSVLAADRWSVPITLRGASVLLQARPVLAAEGISTENLAVDVWIRQTGQVRFGLAATRLP